MQNAVRTTPIRVLIIDDDPLIRTLLVTELRKKCLVAVATEGSEGFQKALELTPDVAVIDVNMPGWDGLKTLEAFRSNPRLKNVKIIMLTADSSKQTVTAAIRGGANDYLIKTTYSKSEFFKKLNRLVPGAIEDPMSASAARGIRSDLPARTEIGGDQLNGAIRYPQHDIEEASPLVSSPLFVTEPPQPVGAVSDSAVQEMIDGWE